jgi:hypothetical protein
MPDAPIERTTEAIARSLYGDTLHRLTHHTDDEPTYFCVHIRDTKPDAFFACPIHLQAGMMCKECMDDHAWTHRGRGCDHCGAVPAEWDAMPMRVRLPLPEDIVDHPITRAARPSIYLIGPALCLECASVFRDETTLN